jgi:hypothetical protein
MSVHAGRVALTLKFETMDGNMWNSETMDQLESAANEELEQAKLRAYAGLTSMIIRQISARLRPPPGSDETVDAVLNRALEAGDEQAQALCSKEHPPIEVLIKILRSDELSEEDRYLVEESLSVIAHAEKLATKPHAS